MKVSEDKASARRTSGRLGMGQVLTQPNAQAAREEAKRVLAEALEAGVDGREEAKALEFVKPNPVRPIAAPTQDRSDLVDVSGWKVRIGGYGLISEKQAKWIVDIASRPSVTDEMRSSLAVRLEQGFARNAGTQFITKYKDTPKEPTIAQAAAGYETSSDGVPLVAEPISTPSEVQAGRYAVEHEGVLKFFRVTKGTGRWEGRTFVEVQASDDRYPVRNPGKRQEILTLIAAEPEAAATRYGVELGSCHRCGRTLTDATSRELGIGPDCRSK